MNNKNLFLYDTSTRFPMIMAPMFLVSNIPMIKAAMQNGITGVFPSLNFRNEGELENVLKDLNEYRISPENKQGNYGVNLIVQRSNPLYQKHLKICMDAKVPFYITSLGSPAEVIEQAHLYGAKVYCDVTNIEHAQKCFDLNCDGFIAVGQGAGGHAGSNPLHLLIPSLRKHFPAKPVIAAGGIASGEGILSMIALGASGVSIGTRFIASKEATVNDAYKNAIVQSTMDDIVMTERISGTPCAIINTPYAKKIGYKQGWLERVLSSNKTTKKYFKMLTQIRGMRKLADSVHPGNYKTLWCAGKSVELIDDVKSVNDIIHEMETELELSKRNLLAIL